jgi:hypothetical protein
MKRPDCSKTPLTAAFRCTGTAEKRSGPLPFAQTVQFD